MTDYNDFGFTAMDADELAAIDTTIVAKTQDAAEINQSLYNYIRPCL